MYAHGSRKAQTKLSEWEKGADIYCTVADSFLWVVIWHPNTSLFDRCEPQIFEVQVPSL